MDINYELYKVFYHVASTLSFSEASKQLFISQSAVSQSIKVLEKKLNQTLFIRSTKKVQLTPEGEILLKHVEPAMNLIRQGENQLLDSNSLNGGQLRIGASDTICRYYLVPFLSEFHKRYPNIHIKVTNRTSIECARLLDNGQVDFILTNYPNSGLGGTQNIHVLREFNDIFVANETYFPMKDRPVTLRELQAGGVTIVITSHILAELQERVDRLAILASGKLQALGSVQALREQAHMPLTIHLTLAAADRPAALGLLSAVSGISAAETPEGLHVDCPRGSKMAVLGALAPLGTALQDLQIQEPSLEDVYFDLRKG